jgi:signal transduction histidine kinase
MNLATLVNKARNSDPELVRIAEEGEQLVRDLSKEIRTTSYLLHPPLLDESGVGEALLWYIRGLRDRSGLNITLAIPKDFGRLSRDMELAIFRIVQECLTNVHRHSDSKIARIRIARNEHAVIIEVEDEGKGIPAARLAELQSQGGGVGIRGMRERVFQLGGELKIRSQRGGTTVSITLPFVKALPVKMPEYVERSQAAE